MTRRKYAREELIKTAIKLIETQGYSNVSTNQIAKEANKSIGTLYYYFPKGKPDIIKEIMMAEFVDIFKEEIPEDITKEQVPKLLKSLIRLLLQQHRKYESLITAVGIAMLSDKELFNEMEVFDMIGHRNFIPAISNNILRFGKVNPEYRERISQLLFLVIDDIIHRYAIYPNVIFKYDRITDEEIIDFLVDLVLKYIDFYE